ncbi:outer membrane beta-barrel protein [Fastidiosibacter lacustris]|uniref:outer membrane beta-barrel protein n=1 Tax=Fastidiosibacter lacustris TaxID=2056695 RepID=UPI000E3414B1|nr:outer membrane beta-barrel protein [Fastidiosibacter lacustris]
MKKIIATSIVAAALISGSAFAANAQTGMVMGGNLGYTMPSGDFKNIGNNQNYFGPNSGANNKNGNIAGGLFAGFDYAISPMFSLGAEVGVQYANQFAKYSLANVSGKANLLSIPLFLVGKFYIPGVDGLNVFGKAGYAYNQLGVKVEAAGVKTTINDNRFDPVVAAGVGYKIGQANIFAQYQYNWLKYQQDSATPKLKGGLSTISLGLSYTLPM